MSIDDPQNVWAEYYERKKAERLEQASALWNQMHASGVRDDTVLHWSSCISEPHLQM